MLENITDNWIVANPFNRTNSNTMITNATNYTDSRIGGLIFISDSEITAQRIYTVPELISRISINDGLNLIDYSWVPGQNASKSSKIISNPNNF